jgi:hypothetical protein
MRPWRLTPRPLFCLKMRQRLLVKKNYGVGLGMMIFSLTSMESSELRG